MTTDTVLPNTRPTGGYWARSRSVAPKRAEPVVPEALRAVTIASGLRGTVVNGNTVQSESDGRRYPAAVGHLSAGDACVFDLVRDPAVGSRLTVAQLSE
jgi:hypothetical protein